MFRKKVYGQSKVEKCPFCGKTATTENEQGVPTCISHKNEELLEYKCMCGEYLEMRKGKWGPFFLCMRCGPISFKKGMEVNEHLLEQKKAKQARADEKKPQNKSPGSTKDDSGEPKKKKETVITSDEVDLYYS